MIRDNLRLSPPLLEVRIKYFINKINFAEYKYLSLESILNIINSVVYNTSVDSYKHYSNNAKHYIEDTIKKKLKKEHDIAYIKMEKGLTKLSRIWLKYYYRPNGPGEKNAKKHFEESIVF
tara:strand:- start:230 stop:589 length:360 start_codon:yes stop_codon:yes gene_type:complete